ncbi:helix-turn-helix domain-containing protein [Nodosilinea sp. AN01ver1]|uniref:helix-turn-helix domain-containing protein n=1 Tax=Nodosilinea sp. AN01ver1 TaxID=3423362 RepID=UPI003D323CE5
MSKFRLRGSELAQQSGLTTAQISNFRNGQQNIRIDSLEKLLEAMPREARLYMLSLIAENGEGVEHLSPKPDQADSTEDS